MINYKSLSEQDLVALIINNDDGAIHFFFYEKCQSTIRYIIRSVFDGGIDYDELINELYIHLSKNNWEKLRSFRFQSKLMTWTSVVATRFFISIRDSLVIDSRGDPPLKVQNSSEFISDFTDSKIDISTIIGLMPNKRYQLVLRELEINDMKPDTLALSLGTNVDNLYNMRRRARAQFRTIYEKLNFNV